MKNNNCEKLQQLTAVLLSMTVVIYSHIEFVETKTTHVVNTTSGLVQGSIFTTVNSIKYSAFKGIRYAKPPLGYLRFKPPVAVDRSIKILDATVERDDCIQKEFATGAIVGSEDCLFINVYTPVIDLKQTPKTLKPVMVWIYGGGFTSGTSSSRLYKPDYIIEKHVVYVAFNYRLGALGFLNLYHPNATGNVGLKDQVLGLKWVRDNIENFGGNPKNVTIFGQSAGSASVGYHVLSDASTGLFHGAIMMSGVPMNPWAFQTRQKALAQASQLGAQLGTMSVDGATLLKTLYCASAEEIVAATFQMSSGIVPFVPTLEDETISTDVFLSTCSVAKYTNGNYNKVPQMLGFTDHETLTFFGVIEPSVEIIMVAINIANEIGLTVPPGLQAAKELIDLGINVLDEMTTETLMKVVNETTDILFTAQIDRTQKYLVNNVQPVYYYHVSFYTNRSIHHIFFNSTLAGAGHADDIAYIFYMPNLNYSTDPADPVARTIHRYSTMWTNFVKYGNPTPNWVHDSDLVAWPDSGHSGTSLNIGTELTVGPRPVRPKVKHIQASMEPNLGTINGCPRLSLSDVVWSFIDDIVNSNNRTKNKE